MVRRICESGDYGRRMNRNQELVNILLSVAVADAIGADVQFMPNPTKRDLLAQVNGDHPLRVTDDTQMSLFTAEALLKGYKSREFQRAYLRWSHCGRFFWMHGDCAAFGWSATVGSR